MTSATAVAARDVSKTFGATRALREVDLTIREGQVHALVGGNGSGKSTLIKIMAGAEPADPGASIEVRGVSWGGDEWNSRTSRAAGMRFVHQDLCVFPMLSVAENLGAELLAARGGLGWISSRDLNERGAELLRRCGSDVDPRAPLASIGPADRAMVAVLRALHDLDDVGSCGILVLDEPTASLPVAEVDLLFAAIRRLASAGHAILYVSHRLDEVLAVTDQISVLRDGRRVATLPTCELEEPALIELITGEPLAPVAPVEQRPRAGRPVLSVRRLSSARLASVSFELDAGEVLGIAGLLGAGRTELLRLLFGDRARTGGLVELDGEPVAFETPLDAMRHGVVYVPEDRALEAAFHEMTVDDNLAATVIGDYWSRGRLRHADRRRDSRRLLEQFSIRAQSVEQQFRTLSGGNQQKAVVARWLRRVPRLLLLDEPSQGVDVRARADIHRLVREATGTGAAAIVVASDLQELTEIADRVVVMRDGSVIGEVRPPHLDAATLSEQLCRTNGVASR